MRSWRVEATCRALRAMLATVALAGRFPLAANAQAPPAVVAPFDPASLAGEWVEQASTGSWALRRCAGDIRHAVRVRGRALQLTTRCTATGGTVTRHARVSGSRTGDGRLRIRYAPRFLTWAPGARRDFLVLGVSPAGDWIVVGDRARRWLVVWSRSLALDESAFAAALAAARRQGFDIGRLARIPQPSGAQGPPGDH